MSPVAQNESVRPIPSSNASKGGTPEAVGFLVIEQRSTTPLGPRIVHANDELSRLSGYETESLVGSPLGLLYDRVDLPNLIGKLQAIAARPNHCFMERILLRNGGSRLPCRWTIRSTNREGEPKGYFALTVRPLLPDVGVLAPSMEPKRDDAPATSVAKTPVEESAPPTAQAVGEYEACRSESISIAAAGVAHDFKNALQTIKSNLELAALASASGTRAWSHIQEAQLALGDAEMLAKQMLAFTKGERARRRVIQLGHLLERVSRLCSAGSGIRCRVSIPEELRCVDGDPTRIYQVLHNLVINARQAMPNGGTIDIAAGNADLEERNKFAMPPGRYTVASVRDRGCGIPEEVLPCIFDPDFTTKPNGNGFGLASCQSIVEAHGGAIRVASKVGVGTEFLVFLPSIDGVADVEPCPPCEPTRETDPRTRTHPGTGRVLVVEDQPGVARAALGILKQLGYERLHARNGEEAVALYRDHLDSEEPIDIVLLDMTLPGGISGNEVAAELRRLDPAVRIIATSGYFDEGVGLLAGDHFVAVLPKPYSMNSLCEALETVIDG